MKTFVLVCMFLCTTALNADYSRGNINTAARADTTTVKVVNHPQVGKILADSEGRTLYISTADSRNTSNCYDQCAATWPPLLVPDQATATADVRGTIGVAKRRDNKSQVTYNGMPLYYHANDSMPGDINGQEIDNKWFVINPDSGPNKASKHTGYLIR